MSNKIKCIYRLWFEGSNKSYIGSSKDFKSRLNQHIKNLLNNEHPCKTMQIDFNKYGCLDFKFEILEKFESKTSTKKLLERESEYIEKYNAISSGYNLSQVTSNGNNVFENNKITSINFYKEIHTKLKNNNIKLNLHLTNNYQKIYKFTNCKGHTYTSGSIMFSTKQYSNFTETQLIKLSNLVRSSITYKRNDCSSSKTLIIARLNNVKGYITSLLPNILSNKYSYDKNKIKDIFLYDALNPYYLDLKYLISHKLLFENKLLTLLKILESLDIKGELNLYIPSTKCISEFERILKECYN